MIRNPFPGPQPYRAADRARFFGRDALSRKLANQVLARPATTVFGPSGAGKSSLMEAGVLPALEDSDGLRVVRVDAWPGDKAPLPWLGAAMFDMLSLGALPENRSPLEALEDAIDLAERRSDRPILIYLDQVEQLFVSEHSEEEMNALLQGLDGLIQARHQDLHLVLAIREDYLGRLRDWTREQAELSAHSFRVGPLSVGEMVKAMCRTAAEGEPAQRWDDGEIRALMLDVRVPGQSKTDAAEVQTAFGQIVCRALWQERVAGVAVEVQGADAEAILQRYLDATIEGLSGLQEGARRLLEEHLIDEEGQRRLLTEKEARLVLPVQEAAEVLGRLERAAVLHAAEHQGSRYFELGHDWLAKKVFERRLARKREEAEKRRLTEEAVRRRTRRTIAVSYVLVLAAFALTVGWGVQALRATSRDAQLLRAGYVPLLLRIGEVLAEQNVFSAQLNHITTATDPSDMREWLETARRTRPLAFSIVKDAARSLAAADGKVDGGDAGVGQAAASSGVRRFSEEIAAEVTAIERFVSANPERFSQLFQALTVGNRELAERTRDELVKREVEGAWRLWAIKSRVEEQMESLTVEARRREDRGLVLLVILALLTLTVGVMTSLYARRRLGPLRATRGG
ncbi:nSTAND1 domain-containing NTPase [Sorangium sp. So ce1151]|uniref:nSTAND1 domain-containing NTPase n=1 Tax=Sorangium sp. So ce1151 TaxID=3133332 RepID=UPI003F633BDB